ncbi:hypothetical protein PIB30_094892, partial [Stylosanthes scabra]|nr:hypothetical protein [Stylosanthes scabra]
RRYRINSMKINGRLYKGKNQILEEVRRYFRKLYADEESLEMEFDENLVKQIRKEDKEWLERMPTRKEIKEAIWDCEPTRFQGRMGIISGSLERCGM